MKIELKVGIMPAYIKLGAIMANSNLVNTDNKLPFFNRYNIALSIMFAMMAAAATVAVSTLVFATPILFTAAFAATAFFVTATAFTIGNKFMQLFRKTPDSPEPPAQAKPISPVQDSQTSSLEPAPMHTQSPIRIKSPKLSPQEEALTKEIKKYTKKLQHKESLIKELDKQERNHKTKLRSLTASCEQLQRNLEAKKAELHSFGTKARSASLS